MPELETEALLLQRIFLAEKWLVARLHYGHVDPREAGVGNIVNCGAAMYMAPVGVVNAGDPAGAYAEAIEVAGAHQSSYGREAAGVLRRRRRRGHGAGRDRRVGRRRGASRSPTTAPATRSTRSATPPRRARPTGARRSRRCARRSSPFDTVGRDYRDRRMDARRPSRTKSIEELPVALGLVLVADGDYDARGPRRGQLRPRRRLDRHAWPARSAARSAAWARCRPTGRPRVAAASRTRPRAGRAHDGRGRRARSSPRTPTRRPRSASARRGRDRLPSRRGAPR